MKQFEVRTRRRSELIDVTGDVQRIVTSSGTKSGFCVCYVPHTTAACTINENADPDVPHDILLTLDRLVPKDAPGYRHGEGNSDSHVKASLVGSSVTVLIEDGRLVLGTWQGIFFCEFDGPRTRNVFVQVVPS